MQTEVIYQIKSVEEISTEIGSAMVVNLVDKSRTSLKAFATSCLKMILETSVQMVNGSSNLWVSSRAPETRAKAISTMRSFSADGSLNICAVDFWLQKNQLETG